MGGAGGGKGKGRGEAERGKVEGNEEKGGKNRERMSGGEKIVEDGGTSAHSAQVLLDFGCKEKKSWTRPLMVIFLKPGQRIRCLHSTE